MKILLAITGASGVIYGERILKELTKVDEVKVELIVSSSGAELIDTEIDTTVEELKTIADICYDPSDLAAPPSSGSNIYDAMLIVPCSMSTLSKISCGIADNLISRSASVFIKEGRNLILVPRETPLSTISLKNMYRLSQDGVVILPAAPGFYSENDQVTDLVNFITGKILDNLGIENNLYERWKAD